MQTAVVVLESGLVALFGVASAVLGFKAEATRLTPDKIYGVSGGECLYPANPVNTLGICAIFLLVVAQIIASSARGGRCCRRPPGGASSISARRRRVVGFVACVLSWIAAVIAVALYRVGVTPNASTTLEARFRGEECYVLKCGVFVTAAVLSLVATSLGITSCVLLRLPAATEVPVEGQHVVDPKLAPPARGQAHAQVRV